MSESPSISQDQAEPVSVTQLVRAARSALRATFGVVRVTGEISNFKRPASGHCYFTLKDADTQLRCVMFRSDAARLSFAPQDGMQVVVSGQIDIYEARGDLQLRAIRLQSAGEGALQKAFERLRKRLADEGLFDESRKSAIPPFPRRVGIVTSRTGAALQDILTVLERRYPLVHVILAPVAVQGVDAAQQIAETIQLLDEMDADDPSKPDVLIVGRGGGSAEDLWSFNEEVVARTVFACRIPIVSAVGHETDFSITDFVADRRAATPSAAAEIVVPDRAALVRSLKGAAARAEVQLRGILNIERRRLRHLVASAGFRQPLAKIGQIGQRLDDVLERMRVIQSHRLAASGARISSLSKQLEALNPKGLMERGYVRVERDGVPIHRGADVSAGDTVRLHFADSPRDARIVR